VPLDDAPAQAEFRERVRRWLNEVTVPRAPGTADRADTAEQVEAGRQWQRRKQAAGFGGLTWPAEFGGQGRDAIDQIIWDQEASAFDVAEEAFIVSTMLAGPTIIDVGRPEQRGRFLPPILAGDAVWCQLFSEPSAGSDLAAVLTRAVRDGDDWVVDGQKVWSSGAHYADWGLLLARTDPEAGKHAGLSMFALDMRTPGITVRPIKQITGAEHFNEVFLDAVRVPAGNLLGGAGNGWPVARTTLGHERLGLIHRRRVDVADFVELARRQLGADLATADAGQRRQVADICMRAEALRLLNERIVAAVAAGVAPGPEASVGKIAGARLLNDMGRFTTELLGADGLLDGPDADDGGRWQYAFLDATARRIAGGSDEIQRNIIAERVLGMPRDPVRPSDRTSKKEQA
jgi:alkylation response protein AidB-like acyl-CoA dehydrogenase